MKEPIIYNVNKGVEVFILYKKPLNNGYEPPTYVITGEHQIHSFYAARTAIKLTHSWNTSKVFKLNMSSVDAEEYVAVLFPKSDANDAGFLVERFYVGWSQVQHYVVDYDPSFASTIIPNYFGKP